MKRLEELKKKKQLELKQRQSTTVYRNKMKEMFKNMNFEEKLNEVQQLKLTALPESH